MWWHTCAAASPNALRLPFGTKRTPPAQSWQSQLWQRTLASSGSARAWPTLSSRPPSWPAQASTHRSEVSFLVVDQRSQVQAADGDRGLAVEDQKLVFLGHPAHDFMRSIPSCHKHGHELTRLCAIALTKGEAALCLASRPLHITCARPLTSTL